jgi:hypothetical protein
VAFLPQISNVLHVCTWALDLFNVLLVNVFLFCVDPGTKPALSSSGMKVAFDIASYQIFKNGDFFYPGLAALFSIISSGGIAILFNSQRRLTASEKSLIDKLTASFAGHIIYSATGADGADMTVN